MLEHQLSNTCICFYFQASFLNKKLNIGGKRVNLAIWVKYNFFYILVVVCCDKMFL
jgi:hypothetical protein